MSDIIHLLPDSVANQIAAGEVVQRPASVVKELVENAIDAHATHITIAIVDAGRTTIQISDNGCGMSETDARMAFERHATSKITDASDIFKIRSMGFRGEALASIAAVSQTELKTRQAQNEVGTKIIINGSKVESQEPEVCPIGTTFTVKNLFYNTPARRKFLKTNQTEFGYILAEIYQTALANPSITFTIMKDGDLFAKYPAGNLKQRITNIFGKQMSNGLISIEDESNIVKIYGFIGVPEIAKKTSANQYFFVNNRFFRQKSFQNAVLRAYGNLIQPKQFPPFFIFLDIDPADIDVNIHPTKTEIKFSDEYNICQLLEAAIKYSIGKNNITPTLDFSDPTDYSDLFTTKDKDKPITPPTIRYNPDYNPFKQTNSYPQPAQSNTRNWEKLFEDYEEKHANTNKPLSIDFTKEEKENQSSIEVLFCTQYQKKYIIAFVSNNFYIIDIKRAHYRLLFDKFYDNLSNTNTPIQKTLLPIRIELSAKETEQLQSILPQLQAIGFDIELFGTNSFVVNGIPSDINASDTQEIILNFIADYENETSRENPKEQVARSMAKSAALYRNPSMSDFEMKQFTTQLLENKSFTITPEGQIITIILSPDDLIKKFN